MYWLRDLRTRRRTPRDYLRTSTNAEHIGAVGAVAALFERIDAIPGWFNLDDAGHFWLVLEMQSLLGLHGDLLEIGSYHGRSTAFMAACVRDRERIVVCDAFETETEDKYRDKPSPELLQANIARVRDDLGERVVVHACLSDRLELAAEEEFRFVHIDGGHTTEAVHSDLDLCAPHVPAGGVIAIDDYHHPLWSEVHVGVDRWLDANPGWTVLADVNRHGAQGRKLYLRRAAV